MASPAAVTCVDVGSTFTKAVRVGPDGVLLGAAEHPTTVASDVLDGVRAVCAEVGGAEPGRPGEEDLLVCSSAGGGLRLAVVGYEREVTAEAGFRVGLSAGAKIVHVTSGPLDADAVTGLRGAAPDIVLLVGGTDGGNADVLVHNAARLAAARLSVPVVVAGNAEASADVVAALERTRRRFVVTDNVLPRIGVVEPLGARAAIREVFLTHVIGGKGLSRGPVFGRLVRAATPDAVLLGVEVLAQEAARDVLVVDVGGATTDVYSVLTPQGEEATIRRDVVAPLWHARTVEADLGMRWNAASIVEAAARERLPVSESARRYAAAVASDIGRLARAPEDWAAEEELARAAALVAVRRHARPPSPSDRPRPLTDVGLVVGSGGVLRHAPAELSARALGAVLEDHAGGWRVPAAARAGIDTAYLLFAVGLLAQVHPDTAAALARRLLSELPHTVGT